MHPSHPFSIDVKMGSINGIGFMFYSCEYSRFSGDAFMPDDLLLVKKRHIQVNAPANQPVEYIYQYRTKQDADGGPNFYLALMHQKYEKVGFFKDLSTTKFSLTQVSSREARIAQLTNISGVWRTLALCRTSANNILKHSFIEDEDPLPPNLVAAHDWIWSIQQDTVLGKPIWLLMDSFDVKLWDQDPPQLRTFDGGVFALISAVDLASLVGN
jgi:hypothetical protein